MARRPITTGVDGDLLVPAALGVFTFVKEDWLHDRHMYLVSVPFCLFAAVVARLAAAGKRLGRGAGSGAHDLTA